MATNSTGWQNAQEALRGTTAPSFSKVWWVDSSATTNGATGGYYPNFPANTLTVAQSLTTAGRGDVVYVGPSHAESVVGAAGITLSVDDVFYIGIGVGLARPVITFSTSIAAQMVISGNGIVIRNMVFDCTGIDAITAAIKVTGASVAFEDCEFITNTGTAGCVLGILTAATATRFRVERCRFIGPAINTGTTTTAQIKHEVGTDYVIKDNYFAGKTTNAILNATTVLRGLIDSNRIVTTGTAAINMAAASTPFITNNRMNVASGTAPIVAAAGFMAGNVYSAAAGVTAGAASTF